MRPPSRASTTCRSCTSPSAISTLRLYRVGEWEQIGDGEDPTPEAIRNVVAGALFARGGPVR